MSKLEAEQQSSSKSHRRYARAALSFASHIDTSHSVPCVAETMTMAGWVEASSKPWTRKEHISVLETRASVGTARFIASDPKLHNKHSLVLSDSMAQLLGSGKERSSAPGMCWSLRQLAAAILVANVVVYGRWLPSEINPADKPSRRGLQRRATASDASSRPGPERSALLPSGRQNFGVLVICDTYAGICHVRFAHMRNICQHKPPHMGHMW